VVGGVLFCRVHQVELGLPLHQLLLGGVVPYGLDGHANLGVDRGLGTRVEYVVEEEIGIGPVLLNLWFDFELAHGVDDGFGAFNQVLVDSWPVGVELGLGVALEVDDLHLLHNG